MRFEGKVAVVTAAGSGIGKATSEILVREGATLVAVDLNVESLVDLEKQLAAENLSITRKEVNVLESDQVRNLIDSVIEEFGRIDILVNAVGGSTIIENSTSPVNELTLEDWDKVLDFNLNGTFLCTHEVVKHMKVQNSGKIINISSEAALSLGEPGSALSLIHIS